MARLMTFGVNYKAALQLDSTGHFFFWPAAYYEVLLSETTLFPPSLSKWSLISKAHLVRCNDMMEGFIMVPHFMILIVESIMTYNGEPQSQSALLVNKWVFLIC